MPGAGPDQVLVSSGKDLDRFGVGCVPGERSMIVAVSAHQISEHFGITGVGLRSGHVVTVPIARHRQRVDRVPLIAGRDESVHPQAAVGLDPDDHLARVNRVTGNELVEPTDADQPLREPPAGQPLTRLVHQMDVVMGLRPVIAHEDHRVLPPSLNSVQPEGSPAAT